MAISSSHSASGRLAFSRGCVRACSWTVGVLTAAAAAVGQPVTRIMLEVAADPIVGRWSGAITAMPGDEVSFRVRVRLENPDPDVIGFGGMTYQPTVSEWHPEWGDAPWFRPLFPKEPLTLGRLFPFSSVGMTTNSQSGRLTSFNDSGNTLRFAGANCFTPTTDLRWGVNSSQLTRQLGGTNYNPFLDVVLFVMTVRIGEATGVRTMRVDVPVPLIQNRRATWHRTSSGIDSLLSGVAEDAVMPAFISVVPAPGALGVAWGAGVLIALRRRPTASSRRLMRREP